MADDGDQQPGTETEGPSATVTPLFPDAPAPDADDTPYPMLQYVLSAYFPNVLERRQDRSGQFIKQYRQFGDNKAEWRGLDAELIDAIRHPSTAADLVNATLGTALSPADTRRMLAEFQDILQQTGEHDPSLESTEPAVQKVSADEALQHWFFREVALPGRLKPRTVPLWQCLAGGAGLAVVGYGLLSLNPPSWLAWIPLAIMVLGLLVVAASSIAMWGLRDEVRQPEKTAKREAAKEAARAKQEAKSQRGGTVSRLMQ